MSVAGLTVEATPPFYGWRWLEDGSEEWRIAVGTPTETLFGVVPASTIREWWPGWEFVGGRWTIYDGENDS